MLNLSSCCIATRQSGFLSYAAGPVQLSVAQGTVTRRCAVQVQNVALSIVSIPLGARLSGANFYSFFTPQKKQFLVCGIFLESSLNNLCLFDLTSCHMPIFTALAQQSVAGRFSICAFCTC